MSLKTLLAFLAAMTLIGSGDCARAEVFRFSSPSGGAGKQEDPPPPPECAELVPADTPDCKDADGVWQLCPVPILEAMRCEIRLAVKQARDLEGDLARALASRSDVATSGAEDLSWIRAERDEARRELEGLRGRGRWGWGLGAAGTATLIGGLALVLDGRADVGAGVAVGGAAMVAIGYFVVTW